MDYIFKTSINSKLNFLILNEIMNIFKKMNMVNSKDFIEYLPFILTSLKEMYILFYSDIKKSFKNNFLDVHDLAFFNRVEFQANYLEKIVLLIAFKVFIQINLN